MQSCDNIAKKKRVKTGQCFDQISYEYTDNVANNPFLYQNQGPSFHDGTMTNTNIAQTVFHFVYLVFWSTGPFKWYNTKQVVGFLVEIVPSYREQNYICFCRNLNVLPVWWFY